MRLGVLVVLLPMLAGNAAAGVVGAPVWDPVERVHWAAFRGDDLLVDPAFSRLDGAWATSFVDVGGGEASVEDGRLTLYVPRAEASGAAYADAVFPVRGGALYHFAFQARLLGNASEIATLVIPEGGGDELVLRGEPRANEWGFGGEWVAPPGASRARLVLRFMIVEGQEGGAVFRSPHVGEGPAPRLRVGLVPPPWFLPPGVHSVDADGNASTLLVAEPPPPRVEGHRFVEVGRRVEAVVRAPEAARVELLPSTRFDPFRGWWALHPGETGATLRLERDGASIQVAATTQDANVTLAGILENAPGGHWRLRLDGSLPPGVRGQVFLRERDFPRAGAVETEHVDSSRFIEGEGPWDLDAPRAQPLSRRLEVILVFDLSPGPERTILLRSSSLTVEGELERGVELRGPIGTRVGLAHVRGRALDAFGREAPVEADVWVGSPPHVCAGPPALVAWTPPHDATFRWRSSEGERPVDEQPRVPFRGNVSLVRGDETWWTPGGEEAAVPEVHLRRGGSAEVALPCAAGLPARHEGLKTSFQDGLGRIEAPWWKLPGRETLLDLEGREVALVVIGESSGALLVGLAVVALGAWLVARWRR